MPDHPLKRLLLFFCLIAILVPSGIGLEAWFRFRHWREDLATSIRATRSLAELQDLAQDPPGLHGVFVHTRGGDWVAFLYRDPHDGMLWSDVAVACDSQGVWYSASRHFCGLFDFFKGQRLGVRIETAKRWLPEQTMAMLQRQKATFDSVQDEVPPTWEKVFLARIESSADLAAARPLLTAEGFSRWGTQKLPWMP